MIRLLPALLLPGSGQESRPLDDRTFAARPEGLKAAAGPPGSVTLASDRWGFLVSPDAYADVEIERPLA